MESVFAFDVYWKSVVWSAQKSVRHKTRHANYHTSVLKCCMSFQCKMDTFHPNKEALWISTQHHVEKVLKMKFVKIGPRW